jgi:catechol 2,3-dioxygenase-like lactoylglutathione lyase family enzyme
VRLQHVSIAVGADGAEAARGFYGGLLGLEERDVPPKLDPSELVWFRVGGDLELHCMLRDESPPEGAHLCLVVDEDLDALRVRLEAAGVRTRDTEEIIGRPRFFCWDPAGNRVELTRFES